MLLKDSSTNGRMCVYTLRFSSPKLKQIKITRLLTDSNPSSLSAWGGDNDRRQVLRHFIQ